MSGRLWVDAYPEHARAVCVDGKGWLVASVELPMQGLSRPRRLRQVVKVVRGLVGRLPEVFVKEARHKGFELRGVEPFLSFRKELDAKTGFRVVRETQGGGR